MTSAGGGGAALPWAVDAESSGMGGGLPGVHRILAGQALHAGAVDDFRETVAMLHGELADRAGAATEDAVAAARRRPRRGGRHRRVGRWRAAGGGRRWSRDLVPLEEYHAGSNGPP